ncbi:MAG TPA: hypothetical protein K8V84_07740 [Nocardiopsis listeri]|uniref:hypothetical protein n=1 Tax=Nocardiopsis listeri TaxID=53440 RepID=UPI001DB8DCB8|nr:hypothetical protein [Nocardiopsis listeri]HJE58391.1 hypothetical protein [Nocardiopsis listeri]
MAVDPFDDHDPLPCGTSIDELLDHLAESTLTEHERACPHCRAVAVELRPLVEAMSSRPRVTAPPGLLDDVMREVRAEARSTRTLPLTEGVSGRTEIRHSAMSSMLRASVDPARGLFVGRCRIERASEGVIVSATARVLAGTPIPEAGDGARRDMTAFIHDRLGLRVARVDIDVTDVIDPH